MSYAPFNHRYVPEDEAEDETEDGLAALSWQPDSNGFRQLSQYCRDVDRSTPEEQGASVENA